MSAGVSAQCFCHRYEAKFSGEPASSLSGSLRSSSVPPGRITEKDLEAAILSLF
jgi:hypothetical protein